MYLQALDIMALLSYVTNQFETSTSPGPPGKSVEAKRITDIFYPLRRD